MTFQISTNVNSVEVKGPFSNSKTGSEFFTHLIKTQSGDFLKYENEDLTPQFSDGDSVEIFYDEKKGFNPQTRKRDLTINQVSKIQKVSSSPKLAKPSTQLHAASSSAAPSTKSASSTSSSKSSTTYDRKSDRNARLGGLLHDAVAILVHNSSITGSSIALEDVIGLTRDLMKSVEETLD